MNTLANHGYLPRNGIATLLELIVAQKQGFNVDYDLGAVLAIVAVGLDGDLLSTRVGVDLPQVYHYTLIVFTL